MCAICGIINFTGEEVSEVTIQRMLSEMKHRGPDDEGIFIVDNVGFGHVRLSIIDLTSAGHQPMFSQDKRYCIVYNGEVYNYLELKKELEGKYNFVTRTDTEVILNSFVEWGPACLNRFNGMFAFAIYDLHERSIFLARDRFGIKPLYYYYDKNYLIFASEIPSILSVIEKPIQADEQMIYDYLIFNRTDHTERTFFNQIKALPHAYRLTINEKGIQTNRWYDLERRLNRPFAGVDVFRETFRSAVELRLRSDVPVGVCLSGGLDSSSIVSVLLKDNDRHDLNTFSAVYGQGREGDESEFINSYESLIQNMHYIYPSAESLMNDFCSFVRAHAEPVPRPNIYAQFKVMELAKHHVTVLLDGQGADEQLAGYHYFFGFYFKSLLKQLRLRCLSSELVFYLKRHRSLYGLKSLAFLLLPEFLQTHVRVSDLGYVNSDFTELWSQNSSVPRLLYSSESLNEALIDHFEHKLEHLLKWEDRNSMWFSIEARVPFTRSSVGGRDIITARGPKNSKGKDEAHSQGGDERYTA